MSVPTQALSSLADQLAAERSPVAEHVRPPRPGDEPALGMLVAAAPRAQSQPGEYALVIESVREGYLLHYGRPRVVADPDPDLALLAGDYLYALGIDRLAALGDLDAVAELAELISVCAQVHGERDPERARDEVAALWLATAVAIGTGPAAAHRRAKQALREGAPEAAVALHAAAEAGAAAAGLDRQLRLAADSIDFAPSSSR